MSKNNNDHSSDSRYLDRLTFNPELRKSWLNYFVTNFRVVVLLIVVISTWGLYSFFTLPRESSPEVKIPIAIVTTAFPGASPTDVEQFVTRKIEAELSGLKGLHNITSNSFNSFSSIVVEFEANADIQSSIQALRDAASKSKPNISTEAEDPVVTEISIDDMPIWSISITGPYDGFTLRKYAEDIQNELEKISGVREVNISGGDVREYEIAYRPDRLLYYGITVNDANQAVLATRTAIPSGNFDTETFVVPVKTETGAETIAEISNIPISHSENGSTVMLRDIANVSEKAVKKSSYSRLSTDGQPSKNSVNLSIIKRQGASILETVDAAKLTVEKAVKSFPPGITYTVGQDFAELVRNDFNQLFHDFLLTVLLVSIILFLIVGLKEAFVAGLAIPLVFFITFGCLSLLGISLNFLSMFSLILALGLLVDDAIVVVSATKQYLNTGKFTPEEAVLLVLRDFKWVLTTTTLATVWAFLPLLFATGIIGQYLKSIPITVSITLVASLLIALMVNHPLAAVLERIRLTRKFFLAIEALLITVSVILLYSGGTLSVIVSVILISILGYLIWWYEKGGKEKMLINAGTMEKEWESDELIKEKLRIQGSREHENFAGKIMHGIVDFHLVLPVYERTFRHYILDKKRRRRVLAGVVLLFVFSVALIPLGFVKSVFFPLQDSDYVFIDLKAPVGTNLIETDNRTKSVESQLLGYKEIESMTTIIGSASANSGSFTGGGSGTNLASISITLKDAKERSVKSYEFADTLRKDLASTTNLVVNVSTESGGPPSGSTFEAHIAGDDLDKLGGIIRDLKPMLTSISGVINVNVSQKESIPEYTFVLDPIAMERNNLNSAIVGSVLRTAISGVELTKIVQGEKEIQLIATFDQRSIPDLAAIQNLQILNAQKQPVFLKDIAKIELRPAVDVITRIDQKRTVVLSAGADSSTNGQTILASFEKKLADYEMPAGYTISFGGENEQNAESVASVLRAMLIALVLIVATLIIQFNSFRKALIVLVPIPLALIGVFIGMAVFDVPLSFPGLIGILALFGIVVKNAIILVDKINLNIKSGITFEDAIADAGKSRLEAIFITSICTIIGILPVTLSNELWRSLGGAVIFGLTLSSFLTLYIVPAFFLILVKDKKQHY
ncbi:MAG: efflux RND transporter permease subunit [Candidatus Paceibacterota bacterium]|jgi:HAE1 family hydrophobic/amphiphilic exporter-1